MNNHGKLMAVICLAIALCAGLMVMLYTTDTEKEALPAHTRTVEFYQQREEAVNAFADALEGFSEVEPENGIVQNCVGNALKYLSARIQRGDFPDLFTHWPTQLSFRSMAASGKVVSLEGQPFLDRVEESALSLCRDGSGSVYALPINRNCMEVYYNNSLFDEMGLCPPETVDEMLALCEELKEAGKMPLIFYLRDDRTSHIAQMMMAAINGDYLTMLGQLADGTLCESERERLTETFRLMREMYLNFSDTDAGHTYYEACERFARGECAMLITGSYALSLLREMSPSFEMSVFAFPGTDAQKRTVLTSIDTALCVSASSPYAATALDFLEYLTQEESIQAYVARDGAPSCIKGVRQDDPITREMLRQISDYENAEWVKSRYSLESSLIFDNAVCAYMISGNEDALIEGLQTAFQNKGA